MTLTNVNYQCYVYVVKLKNLTKNNFICVHVYKLCLFLKYDKKTLICRLYFS